MTSSIDILESRMAELEKTIYGIRTEPSMDIPVSKNSLLEDLRHVNTLVSSALSGREKTNILANRLPELNELLQTSTEDHLQPLAKLEIVETMEPEIRKNLELINKLKELSSCLEVDALKNVPELSPKLEELTIKYFQLYQESDDLSLRIRELASTYSKIFETISKCMIDFDLKLTVAEAAAKSKKQVD